MTGTPPMFTPFSLRDLTFSNRVVMSPMCMYSAEDGTPTDFHVVHLGSRAMGGCGLVYTEMTDVSPEGRISEGCAGMYKDEHVPAWKRVTDFVHGHTDAKIGVQLGHAGRKAATFKQWEGGGPLTDDRAWPIVAPSPLPFVPEGQVPKEMDAADIEKVTKDFVAAAERADAAGFDIVELHFAHGYLLSSFISPLTNQRTDDYGGSIENRVRLPIEIFHAVRAVWPDHKPISARISAVDWADGGTNEDDAVEIARHLYDAGIDILTVSTGNVVAEQKPRMEGLWQTPFSEKIRGATGKPTATVGSIGTAEHMNGIIAEGRADLCVIAKGHLYDPYLARHAAREIGYDLKWPDPYGAAKFFNAG